MRMFDYLLMTATVMLFYGLGVTLLTHFMPPSALVYTQVFQVPTQDVNLNSISLKFQENLQGQTKIPAAQFSAMVFYSGNLFIDLALNFLTALPSMVTVIISAILMIFNINGYIANLFITTIWTMLIIGYVLGLLNFLLNLRKTGGAII